MKVVQLVAENFKRLTAVEITPEGNVVEIAGKNGSGKSSVLDAIYVALVGRSANPPKPIRAGEEQCVLKLDLGDLKVTRTFTAKDGGSYTDTLRVENADGLRYGSPQAVLDALLGEIGFDPFEFCQMKPERQAETLLAMVPLTIDLDEYAELDTSDYAKRRDVNRDAAALKAQVQAIPKEDVPTDLPDRDSLADQLGKAAQTNTEIATEELRRRDERFKIDTWRGNAKNYREQAEDLRRRAELVEKEAVREDNLADEAEAALEKLPELGQPVDTDAIREQLRTADAMLAKVEQQNRRIELATKLGTLEQESEALTAAMEKREAERQDALAKADMPIEGLAFAVNEKGKPTVTFNGVPFEQASTAEQLRASTAIAMRANPQLRVLRIKDGSLLDEDSLKLLADLAKGEDFQLWIERVGTGGVGIVMENGAVASKPDEKINTPKKAEKAKAPEKLL